MKLAEERIYIKRIHLFYIFETYLNLKVPITPQVALRICRSGTKCSSATARIKRRAVNNRSISTFVKKEGEREGSTTDRTWIRARDEIEVSATVETSITVKMGLFSS